VSAVDEPEPAAVGTRIWCSVCGAFDATIHVHHGDSHGVPLASPEPEQQCGTCGGTGTAWDGYALSVRCPDCAALATEREQHAKTRAELSAMADLVNEAAVRDAETQKARREIDVAGGRELMRLEAERDEARAEVERLLSENKAHNEAATAAEKDRDEARAEVKRLLAECDALRFRLNDHLFGYICVFCGNKTFHENEEARQIAMNTHLNECKRHPLRTVEAERNEARRERDDYLNELSIVLKRAEKSDAQRLLHQNGYEDEVARCNRALEKVMQLEGDLAHERERRKKADVALTEARRVAIDAWDRSGPQQGYADEMANTEAAIKRYRVRVAAQLEQQPPAEETDDE